MNTKKDLKLLNQLLGIIFNRTDIIEIKDKHIQALSNIIIKLEKFL